MILYLLRHAKAVKSGPDLKDNERKLTPRGKADAFKRANKFRKKMASVELILSSPYPRALETAEIFAAVLKKIDLIKTDDMLVPAGRPEDILRHLRNFTKHNEVMLVGHGPWITELGSLLFSGSTQGHINMKKAGLMILEVDVLAASGAKLLHLT